MLKSVLVVLVAVALVAVQSEEADKPRASYGSVQDGGFYQSGHAGVSPDNYGNSGPAEAKPPLPATD